MDVCIVEVLQELPVVKAVQAEYSLLNNTEFIKKFFFPFCHSPPKKNAWSQVTINAINAEIEAEDPSEDLD